MVDTSWKALISIKVAYIYHVLLISTSCAFIKVTFIKDIGEYNAMIVLLAHVIRFS